MSGKQLYRLKSGSFSRTEEGRRVRYRAGDVLTLEEYELKAFKKRFELVIGAVEVSSPQKVGVQTENQKPPGDPAPPAAPAGGGNDDTPGPTHVGGGMYELPNGDKVKGKEAAAEAWAAILKEQEGVAGGTGDEGKGNVQTENQKPPGDPAPPAAPVGGGNDDTKNNDLNKDNNQGGE